MDPIWIKYYGLIPMTKRGYLIALAGGAVVALLVLLIATLLGRMPPLDTLWSRRNHLQVLNAGFNGWIYNYLYVIVLICLLGQSIDTWCTLRVFARKEAALRRAEQEKVGELLEEWGQVTANRAQPGTSSDDRIQRP